MPGYISRIGLDPELAIISKETGQARSAHTFMDKLERYRFDYDNGTEGLYGSEVERDGAAIEIRSIVPSACRDNIIPYFGEAMRQTSLNLGKKLPGFKLSTTPLFTLDKLSLTDPPEDVLEFGCRPDMDAYELGVKDPSIPEGDDRRYTGGHVHASSMGAKNDVRAQAALAIIYDYFVGVPFVAMLGDKYEKGEVERREFYGQAGSYRYDDKLDKIEFRSLSGRLQLHPVVMGWVIGMIKSMVAGIGDYEEFLRGLDREIPLQQIYETIQNHDYETADKLADKVFKLQPGYKVDQNALANPLAGGGGGTANPYFYERAMRVLIEGRKEGLLWDDDLVFNWGLYEDYEPKHHSYWGVQCAMVGLLDDDIFPMNKLLPKLWDKEVLQKSPIWTHPLNGGKKKYVTSSAAGWLQ